MDHSNTLPTQNNNPKNQMTIDDLEETLDKICDELSGESQTEEGSDEKES